MSASPASPLCQNSCRRAGILLHPTSLPGERLHGDLGHNAYRFVDFLAASGQTIWQVLPLGPTHENQSPYQGLSMHAGNPSLISLELLASKGWLDPAELLLNSDSFSVRDRQEQGYRDRLLKMAHCSFKKSGNRKDKIAYSDFTRKSASWLNDYAIYMAIKQGFNGCSWVDWPEPLRDRDSKALQEAEKTYDAAIQQIKFEQYIFYEQWLSLKGYANKNKVLIFGDMPIFVDYDSVDVWAKRKYFRLDDDGRPLVVAGVPPDYFSEIGQRWGNPHYCWQKMIDDRFEFWLDRVQAKLTLLDMIRIDHFRGFEAVWEIPASEETAINGRWVKTPGDQLLKALLDKFGQLPLVAEDLGVITPEVNALRDKYGLPGMKIMHFAFDGKSDNPYLPENHVANAVVYTGTHDNNTTIGWYSSLADDQRKLVDNYLNNWRAEHNGYTDICWSLIELIYNSIARIAIVPMQDVLSLDSAARMNTPGTTTGNWGWQFEWSQLDDEIPGRLRNLAETNGRLAAG